MSDVDALSPGAVFRALPPDSPFHLASRLACFDGVEVRSGGVGGRGLFATRAFAAREVILREPAVAWQVGGSIASPYLPEALDAVMLQMSPYALSASSAEAALALSVTRSEVIVATFDNNAYGFILNQEDDGDSRALLPIVGLLNSACDANAAAQQAHPSDAVAAELGGGLPVSVLTARRAIKAGEEITVTYVPRAWPKERRREALRATWSFECACARCSLPYDDTVVMRCNASPSSCTRGRVFWPDGGVGAGAVAGTCIDCGAQQATPPPPGCAPGVELGMGIIAAGATINALAIVADRLLGHKTLSCGDSRVFAALSNILDQSAASNTKAAAKLTGKLAQALAEAALVSKFTSLDDLGFDILGEGEGETEAEVEA